MKTKSPAPVTPFEPAESDVREYAYHLFLQSGSIPGRDLDNWLEAKACLIACVPQSESHKRLHRHHEKLAAVKPAAGPTKRVAA